MKPFTSVLILAGSLFVGALHTAPALAAPAAGDTCAFRKVPPDDPGPKKKDLRNAGAARKMPPDDPGPKKPKNVGAPRASVLANTSLAETDSGSFFA